VSADAWKLWIEHSKKIVNEYRLDLTQKKDITIAMVTHGDGGSFWSVAKKGAEQAAKDMGVTLKYSESNNDPEEQAQMIETAVSDGVDGLAVSAPNPDAIREAVKTAVDAKIPVITLNSGAEESASLGAITHVGQTETIAGEGAGKKLKDAGVTKLICIIHEQSNVGLNQRCEGEITTLTLYLWYLDRVRTYRLNHAGCAYVAGWGAAGEENRRRNNRN